MVKCVHNVQFGYEATYLMEPYELFLNIVEDVNDFLVGRIYPDKIDDKFVISTDPGCIEITNEHKYYRINQRKTFFKDLKILEKEIKLLPTTHNEEYLERDGGGHIHLSFDSIEEHLRDKFLENLYILSINNPELNWAFNNPHDIYAANSLLQFKGSMLVKPGYGELNSFGFYHYISSKYKKIDYLGLLQNATKVSLEKAFPIIYRDVMETIEFRFFMMPRDQHETELHFDLAISIYNYIYNITKKGEKLNLKYNKMKELKEITFEQAKKNLLNTFKILGLSQKDISLVKKIKFPIMKTRYSFGVNCLK